MCMLYFRSMGKDRGTAERACARREQTLLISTNIIRNMTMKRFLSFDRLTLPDIGDLAALVHDDMA